jgi:hypothetical protein
MRASEAAIAEDEADNADKTRECLRSLGTIARASG